LWPAHCPNPPARLARTHGSTEDQLRPPTPQHSWGLFA
jgi:hypothetical protein